MLRDNKGNVRIQHGLRYVLFSERVKGHHLSLNGGLIPITCTVSLLLWIYLVEPHEEGSGLDAAVEELEGSTELKVKVKN